MLTCQVAEVDINSLSIHIIDESIAKYKGSRNDIHMVIIFHFSPEKYGLNRYNLSEMILMNTYIMRLY